MTDTTPYEKMSFLVKPSDDEYLAIAMEPGLGGILSPVTPRKIGSGKTPYAALLRLITPLREEKPTPNEARAALRQLLTRRGVNIRDLASRVDYSRTRVANMLNGDEMATVEVYLSLADAANIDYQSFKQELRLIQRGLDKAEDVA